MGFHHGLTARDLSDCPGLSDALQCLDRFADDTAQPLRTTVTRFGYERHLLHADPENRFVILNLIWPPGAATPFHRHLVWCAYTLISGELTEMVSKKDLSGYGERSLTVGTVNLDAGGGPYTHRLVNASSDLARSIHIYGVAPDHYETGVNLFIDELMRP